MISELQTSGGAAVPESVRELVEARMNSPEWSDINKYEQAAVQLPQVVCPLVHLFTPVPGYPELFLYTRKILMPAGTIVSSRIHLFEHPFTIAAGVVSVWDNETGWKTFCAPYSGVTLPGTRRVLFIHEDTTWLTHHVTSQSDPDKVVDEVTYDHVKLGHMDSLSPEKLAELQAGAKPRRELP